MCVRDNTPYPWYDSDIDNARSGNWRMCGGELKWKFIGNYMSPPAVTALLSECKTDYYKNCLEKASNKTMFHLWRSLDGQRTDVNYFHISSMQRSTNSCQVCSASTPPISQQMKNVVSPIVSMCLIQLRMQRSQRFVVLSEDVHQTG